MTGRRFFLIVLPFFFVSILRFSYKILPFRLLVSFCIQAGTLREVEEIIEKASEEDMLVVIDFYSHNCPPCKMIAPLYEELSHEFPDVKFLKINVEENPEARQKFNVDGWPTFVFVKNGDVQDEIVGGNAAKLGLYDMVVKHRSHFEP